MQIYECARFGLTDDWVIRGGSYIGPRRRALLQGHARAGLSEGRREPDLVAVAQRIAMHWRGRLDLCPCDHLVGDRRALRHASRALWSRSHDTGMGSGRFDIPPRNKGGTNRWLGGPPGPLDVARRPLRHDTTTSRVRGLAQAGRLGRDCARWCHDPSRIAAYRNSGLAPLRRRVPASGCLPSPRRWRGAKPLGRHLRLTRGLRPAPSGTS